LLVKRLAFAILVVCAAQTGRAQTPASPAASPATTFRAAVDLVALNVVATDGQDRLVGGLAAHNFAVFEDGVAQQLSFFATSSLPLDLAILLDTSASMNDKLAGVQQAAIGFAATLRDGDRLTLVDINDQYKVLLPLTADRSGAVEAIRGITARGGTALYNGVYLTLREMARRRLGNDEVRRQAVVVLSDGADTASLLSFEDVMEVAKQSGIGIYTITLRTRMAPLSANDAAKSAQSEFAMKTLAQETGAKAFFPYEIAELTGVYDAIAAELGSQYALGYTSTNLKRDGSFRRVSVRIVDRPGIRIRTRSGYIASRPERVTAAR
jgi:VWFA-related protein